MNLKVRTGLIATVLMSFFLLAACGGSSGTSLAKDKINVFTSFYPLYDFASKVGGNHVHVVNLVPAGVEPHDWSPKSRELADLSKAQLFVYNGAGLEGWVPDFISSLPKDSKLNVLEATAGMKLLEGSESDGHDQGKDGGKAGTASDLNVDPHVWLNPVIAKQIAGAVKDKLIKIDPANAADYEANYKSFADQLTELDRQFADTLTKAKRKDMVVSHQAFGYLCKQYGLTQMPIMGLAPDSEPTSQDIKRISEFAKAHDVKTIFFEELVSDKLAKTLATELGIKTMVLNPLEGLTEEELKAGSDYVSVMKNNLSNLAKALNE